MSHNIKYSDRYSDDQYEYRHVILPPEIAKVVPNTHLLTETEWRNIGVQQSPGLFNTSNKLQAQIPIQPTTQGQNQMEPPKKISS
jgi:hypothetical protein